MSERRRWLRSLIRNHTAVLGAIILLVAIGTAAAAPLLSSKDPMALDVTKRLVRPGIGTPMGTDQFGRDVFARVLHGGRLSLQVALLTVLLSTVAGTLLGLIAGFYRRLDAAITRAIDAVMAFPALLFAIAIMGILGPKVGNVIAALSIVSAPRVARVVRASVLVAREEVYVEAARAAGVADWSIMLRHILPNSLSPIIIQATYNFATAILSESSLSFLGVGAPPQVPSWGNILSEGRLLIGQAPWLTFFPGFAIVLVVLGANLFGDGLRDALDPRLRGLGG